MNAARIFSPWASRWCLEYSIWRPAGTTDLPGAPAGRRCLQLGRQRGAARRDLEDVLVEPRVVHRVEAVLALVGAPAILHPPLAGGAVEDVHAGEEHGVGHLGLVVEQPVGLAEGEGRVIHRGV